VDEVFEVFLFSSVPPLTSPLAALLCPGPNRCLPVRVSEGKLGVFEPARDLRTEAAGHRRYRVNLKVLAKQSKLIGEQHT